MTKWWLSVMILSSISCQWVTLQSSMNQGWHVTIIAKYRPRPVTLWAQNTHQHTNNHRSNVTENTLLKCGMLKTLQSALGLCLIEPLCSQQLCIIGGQCQCQSKAPTAPNWSEPSLQMSLRCQLKSFSWNWDERLSCDGSLTATKLVWRPEGEGERVRVREWRS